MNEHFKTITDALVKEGFPELTQRAESQGKAVDFNITPYSLNTKLSFKFDSLDHFVEFLKLHEEAVEEKRTILETALRDRSLDPKEFFWVNFFEKGKEEEM